MELYEIYQNMEDEELKARYEKLEEHSLKEQKYIKKEIKNRNWILENIKISDMNFENYEKLNETKNNEKSYKKIEKQDGGLFKVVNVLCKTLDTAIEKVAKVIEKIIKFCAIVTLIITVIFFVIVMSREDFSSYNNIQPKEKPTNNSKFRGKIDEKYANGFNKIEKIREQLLKNIEREGEIKSESSQKYSSEYNKNIKSYHDYLKRVVYVTEENKVYIRRYKSTNIETTITENGYLYDKLGRVIKKTSIITDEYTKEKFIKWENIKQAYYTEIFYKSNIIRNEIEEYFDKKEQKYMITKRTYKNNKIETEIKNIDFEGDYSKISVYLEKRYDNNEKLNFKIVDRYDRENITKSHTVIDLLKKESLTEYYKNNELFALVKEKIRLDNKIIIKREKIGENKIIWELLEKQGEDTAKYIYIENQKNKKEAAVIDKINYDDYHREYEIGIGIIEEDYIIDSFLTLENKDKVIRDDSYFDELWISERGGYYKYTKKNIENIKKEKGNDGYLVQNVIKILIENSFEEYKKDKLEKNKKSYIKFKSKNIEDKLDEIALSKVEDFKNIITVTNDKTKKNICFMQYEVTKDEYYYIMKYGKVEKSEIDKPIANISWYDAVQFCNQASKRIGFKPYYNISEIEYYTDEEKITSIKSAKVTENKSANGYRLPTLEEWQYAAKGGSLSKNYTYSGSNDQDEVAWWYFKSKKRTIRNYEIQKVGTKKPNEIGLYDMTGNVNEWTNSKYIVDGEVNYIYTGGSIDDGEEALNTSFYRFEKPEYKNSYIGMRIVRNK